MQDVYIVEKRYPDSDSWGWEPWFTAYSLGEVGIRLQQMRQVIPAGMFEYRILRVLETDTI